MESENKPDDIRKMQVLEQYKSLVGDVGNVGTRYATANGFYLSVLTALLGVVAYAGAAKPFEDISLPVIFLVAVFAIAICWIWAETIRFYGKLFGGKFAILKELETELAVRVYQREDKEVYVTRGATPLTKNEVKVPIFLGCFFLVIAVVSAIIFVLSLLPR
jgi:hypothetical protein